MRIGILNQTKRNMEMVEGKSDNTMLSLWQRRNLVKCNKNGVISHDTEREVYRQASFLGDDDDDDDDVGKAKSERNIKTS